MQLSHWDEAQDGRLTQERLCAKLEGMGYSVARYVYPPGTRFPEHKHGVDKIDAVLSGRFRMTMAGKTVVLEAGDMLVVPQGVLHSAEVVGQEPVYSLDAIKR